MNILLISPFFYPHIGGSQKYMEELYLALVKKYSNISVDVLTYNTSSALKQEKYKTFNIYRIPSFTILPGQFILPNTWDLLKFLSSKSKSYDLIHTSTRFFDSSWWGPVYAKIIGKKIFITDHCGDYPVHSSFIISITAKFIDKFTSSIFLPMYDVVFTSNKYTKDFLDKIFRIKSSVIYGGVEKKHVYKTSKKNQVLFVGRMIDSKGAKMLFDVACKIKNIQFIFVGPGPLTSELSKEIKNQKINNIKILGGLPFKEVQELMKESAILVHPSFHNEGFPNVLTEAGANKMAVIATDVGGTKEIILNNKTGILIRPKDKKSLEDNLQRLLSDKKLTLKLSQNLYNHVYENFSWAKGADQLYKEILKVI